MSNMTTGKRPSDYSSAVQYIEELPKFTKKHTIEHTKEFYKRLKSPASDRKIIHVAGTNGKGSVCAYIQAILESEGKKTGFFTSPHLVSINERIQIGRKNISDEEFYRVFEEVYDTVEKMGREGISHPSYFEFLYGMGMKAFSHTDVEYIVLETGLGGRLDATNSFDCPALTVITSISMDHTEILGDTIEKIAAEKAGIIKPRVPVFFDGNDRCASKVIRDTAESCGAPCREITKNAFEIQEVNRKYIAFSRANAYDKDINWRVPVCGLYQAMNAELSIQAAEFLLKDEFNHKELWREAVASIHWKGRMEEKQGRLVIDGAHNPGAIKAFVESVHALEGESEAQPVILFSAAADKKYEEMAACLCKNLPAKAYIVTEIEDKRRISAAELGKIFKRNTKKKVIERKSIEEALKEAYKEQDKDGYIYCVGSLYLAGTVEKILEGAGSDA